MTLDITKIRSAVNRYDAGYLKLDDAKGDVTTFATNGLVRGLHLYKSPSAEQNREVRLQFFYVLTQDPKISSQALKEVRQVLGLSRQAELGQQLDISGQQLDISGQQLDISGQQLDIRTARRVLQIVDQDPEKQANRRSRQQLLDSAFPDGQDPWNIKSSCADFLGLEGSSSRSRLILGEEEADAFWQFMDNVKKLKRETMLRDSKLLPMPEATRKFLEKEHGDLCQRYYDLSLPDSSASPESIRLLCREINQALIDKVMSDSHDKASRIFMDLNILRMEQQHYDFHAHWDEIKTKVESSLMRAFCSEGNVIEVCSGKKMVDNEMERIIKNIYDKVSMTQRLEAAKTSGRISNGSAALILDMVEADIHFGKPGMMDVIMEYKDIPMNMIKDICNLKSGDLSAIQSLLQRNSDFERQMELALQARDIKLNESEKKQFVELLFKMGYLDASSAIGGTEEARRGRIPAFIRELSGVRELLKDIQNGNVDIQGSKVILPEGQSCAEVLRACDNSIEFLEGILSKMAHEKPAPGLVPKALDLPDATRNFMADKNFRFIHTDAFKPVKQKLSENFQNSILNYFKSQYPKSREETVPSLCEDAGYILLTGALCSMSINGKSCRDIQIQGKGSRTIQSLKEFFANDPTPRRGTMAARMLLSTLKKNISTVVRNNISNPVGEHEIFEDAFIGQNVFQKIDFRRNGDGSYELDMQFSYSIESILKNLGLKPIAIDPARSALRSSLKLILTFDENDEPVLSFREAPLVSGELRPLPQEEPQVAPEQKKRLAMNKSLLGMLGVSTKMLDGLYNDVFGTGNRLTDDIIQKMVSLDKTVRSQGIQSFLALCKPLVDEGILKAAPDLSKLELLCLRTLPVFSGSSGELELFDSVCKYVNNNANDQKVKELMACLKNGEIINRDGAITAIKSLVYTIRSGLSLEYLLVQQLKLSKTEANWIKQLCAQHRELDNVVQQFLSCSISNEDARAKFTELKNDVNKKEYFSVVDSAVKKFKFTGEMSEKFKALAEEYFKQSASKVGVEFNVMAECEKVASVRSPVLRALRIHDLMPQPKEFSPAVLISIVKAVDVELAKKNYDNWGRPLGEIDYRGPLYEMVVLQDLLFKKKGVLPTPEEVQAAITAPDNWYDKLIFMSAHKGLPILSMVLAMPTASREAFVREVGQSQNITKNDLKDIAAKYGASNIVSTGTTSNFGNPLLILNLIIDAKRDGYGVVSVDSQGKESVEAVEGIPAETTVDFVQGETRTTITFPSVSKPKPKEKIYNQLVEMCGSEHTVQIANACLCLTPQGMAPLFDRAPYMKVRTGRNPRAIYSIQKSGDNLLVEVKNPVNCPLRFSWTFTLGPQGEQSFALNYFKRV